MQVIFCLFWVVRYALHFCRVANPHSKSIGPFYRLSQILAFRKTKSKEDSKTSSMKHKNALISVHVVLSNHRRIIPKRDATVTIRYIAPSINNQLINMNK